VVALEWVLIEPGMVVVATPERAWLHRLPALPFGDPFLLPMSGPGSIASTRKLLDAVIGLAACRAPQNPPRPIVTPEHWVWVLITQYHTTHPSSSLMREAAERLRKSGRPEVAEFAAHFADEEAGDDELALADLTALGYRAKELVAAVVPSSAQTLTAHFARTVRSGAPVGFLGYTYAVERLALTIGQRFVDEVQSLFPTGVDATRCTRVHSSLGAEMKHVAEAVAFITTLPASDRALVARRCYETAWMLFSLDHRGDLDDAELRKMLSPFRACLSRPDCEETHP
jgi:hypothetical protein